MESGDPVAARNIQEMKGRQATPYEHAPLVIVTIML
jgi:hypothetical protein